MVDEEGSDNNTAKLAPTAPTAVGQPGPGRTFVSPSRPTSPDDTAELEQAIVSSGPSLPSRIGRYRIERRIGVGGFASVFAAVDPDLDAPVAIKVLADNHSADVEVRRRFVAEARVARRLGSDRLIGVYDLGETDDGRPFVVMELADRGTLRRRFIRLGPASICDVRRLVEELGACMAAIHAKGVIHRDIKPTNLLLRSIGAAPVPTAPLRLIGDDERLVLADFGLARDISDGASAMTIGGGTAGYMAPEQADPLGQADHRADLYAATVVVAELATGRHPERLDLGTSSLPSTLLEVIGRGLSIDREMRPATADEWRRSLLDALAEPGDHNDPADNDTDHNHTDHNDPDHNHTDHNHTDHNHTDHNHTDHNDPDHNHTDHNDPPEATRRIDDTRVLVVDRTDIRAPFPYDGDYEDDSLVVAEPRSFVAPDEATPPPPPPSIPLNPRVQRPIPVRAPATPLPPLQTIRAPATPPAAARPVPPISTKTPPPATAPARTFTPAHPIGRPTASSGGIGHRSPPPVGPSMRALQPAVAERRPDTPPVRSGPAPPPVPDRSTPVPDRLAPVPERPGRSLRSERRARIKARRRWDRRRRRHLRRVRAVNLVRAVIRASLGLILTLAITTGLALRSSGAATFEQLTPGGQGAVLLLTALGTLFSIVVFPWPRRRPPDFQRIGPPPPPVG